MSVNNNPAVADAPAKIARHYSLICSHCGRRQVDNGTVLECPEEHPPALLLTDYADYRFRPQRGQAGLFRYRNWLPVVRTYKEVGRTIVYRSQALAKALQLEALWIAFNGYWPERSATLETATFKELEAYTVLGRLPDQEFILTVASSGNTGAAFAWACSQQQVPCLVVVPARGLSRFKFRTPLHPCVNIVAIDDGDYPDAIELAASIAQMPSFRAEGGVRNVGRRDGLATVLLSAFEEMECLPSHYFQAVGSGAGAIAVLEAAKRLRRAQTGVAMPMLMMCQNRPFTPIKDAWQTNTAIPDDGPGEPYRNAVRSVYADELTNWRPPYAVRGGVHDSLVESRGDVLVADNAAVRLAMQMFMELEGIDIEPAAGVAVACLRDAVVTGKLSKESVVLLNVTGGGRLRLTREQVLIQAEPQLRLTRKSLARQEAVHKAAMLGA